VLRTSVRGVVGEGDAVSILTRPEGRALQAHKAFNQWERFFVSILTRPEGRVLQLRVHSKTDAILFQSSPALRGGCYIQLQAAPPNTNVSILTRPEGRVLLGRSITTCHGAGVSILTRPEGRVLLWWAARRQV